MVALLLLVARASGRTGIAIAAGLPLPQPCMPHPAAQMHSCAMVLGTWRTGGAIQGKLAVWQHVAWETSTQAMAVLDFWAEKSGRLCP